MSRAYPLPNDGALEEAQRHVRRKRIFYIVLGAWLALCVMWFVIDISDDSSSFWFYWPILGSGTGVAVTGIVLLGVGGLFGADWEQREIDKYLRRQGRSQTVGTWPDAEHPEHDEADERHALMNQGRRDEESREQRGHESPVLPGATRPSNGGDHRP